MYFYLFIIFLIIIIFGLFKNKNHALIVSFFLLTLVSALRKYTVGVDTAQFCKAFLNIGRDTSWNYTNFRYEPGFYYLSKILYSLFKSPQSLIIVSSIFINYSVYNLIKKNSKDYFFSTLLFINMNIFFSYMNVMRAAIAVAILLYGYKYIKERIYVKYLIVVLIAFLFHKAAIGSLFLVVFMMLPRKKSSYLVIIATAIATFVLYKPFFGIISSLLGYSDYANGSFGIGNTFAAVLRFLETLVTIVTLSIIANIKERGKTDKDIYVLFVIALIYLWFQFLSIKMIIFNRVYGLYDIYLIIFIPMLLGIIKEKNHNNYKFLKLFIICLYFPSFLVISHFRPEWFGVIPYTFFWN